MHFIADAMLGRLARWLRLLGFDTLYYPDIKDRELLRLAMRERRFILTRDTHFLKIKGLKNLHLLRSDKPIEQITEVLALFPIQGSGEGRCASCNGVLCEIGEKTLVRDLVPEYVFLECSGFLRCEACGKVYWGGTHLKRFRRMLANILLEGKVSHESA